MSSTARDRRVPLKLVSLYPNFVELVSLVSIVPKKSFLAQARDISDVLAELREELGQEAAGGAK